MREGIALSNVPHEILHRPEGSNMPMYAKGGNIPYFDLKHVLQCVLNNAVDEMSY